MIEVNKQVRQYINDVPQTGAMAFLAGIALLVILLKVTLPEPLINLPFGALGFVLGYYAVTKVDPGGRVNFWLWSPITLTTDQKILYDLIASYKSNKIILLTMFIGVMLMVLELAFTSYSSTALNLSTIILVLFWSSLTMLILGNGVKYISAWWNINMQMRQ